VNATDNARQVRCPTCGGPSQYSQDNAFRPFCSERCKNLDFGAWASEAYRVQVPPSPQEGEPEAPL
jgi:endogenous inhibitor of DNA gyrase (YacG/DUF329 family)